MKKKVIIIGAGPAGITAAHRLLSSGGDYEVTVVEESDDIGGISKTVRHNGNRMDIGGHRFFSKDTEVTRWWNEIMPLQGAPSHDDILLGRKSPLSAGGPDPEKEDRVMLTRRRISRIYYRGKFFDYPISMKAQTIKNMGFSTTINAGMSYLGSCVKKRTENSLEDFYINRFGKVLYSMFFEGYTEKLWGRHPSEISADWGAQRVKGLSVTAVIKDMLAKLTPRSEEQKKQVETSLIEEFSYPKFGPGQLWETAASEVEAMGGRIIRNCKVINTESAEHGRISRVICDFEGKQTVFDADYFISSMPLCDLVKGMNDVPENIAKIAAGLPYRDFVTVGLLVKKLNLVNETDIRTLANIVPDCWIYVQDTGVKLGRIQIFNNWSPYLVADPENTVWVGLEYFCTEGDAFWNMTEDECTSYAVKELVKMGVIDSGAPVLDSHRERIKKAYPAYFDTYKDIDKLTDYLNTYSNLYCIGRNGQHRYNNMDHSMVTAFRAADAIMSGKTDKTEIWNVNTEKDYHEEK
ncbi:MAG: NAD(P)/FAD-dependent oxidoreductase [Clostridiales bacterium]|nr:NAD(P)/FAD-dependent oxidoreductase [Clostridiales bacterium]